MSLQESEPSLRKSVFCVYKSQNWEFTKAGIQSFKKLESSLQKSKLWVYKSQSRDDKSLNSVFTRVRTVFTKDGILSLKQDSEKKSELWKYKSELKKDFFYIGPYPYNWTIGQEGLLFLFFYNFEFSLPAPLLPYIHYFLSFIGVFWSVKSVLCPFYLFLSLLLTSALQQARNYFSLLFNGFCHKSS